jgi:hypothetical protein
MSSYCLVSISPGSGTEERVYVGLLFLGSADGMFHLSENRLESLRVFYDRSTASMVRSVLRNFKKEWSEPNHLKKQLGTMADWSPERLSYLNRYSNNLIHFSEVMNLSLPYTVETFKGLTKRFFDEDKVITTKPRQSFKRIVNQFFEPLANRLNLDYEFGLSDQHLPALTTEVKVKAAGRNEQPFISQDINFGNKNTTIFRHTAELQALHDAFRDVGEEAKIFVIGEEPDHNSPQHDIWKRVHEVKFFDFVPLGEKERITEYITVHDVQMYSHEEH